MKNASARNLWGDYLDTHLQYAFAAEPRVRHVGDNQKDADEALKMVLKDKKKALSHSLLNLQLNKEPLPRIGDFTVLTDWEGNARCILRTVAVRLKPYFSIRESFAKLDGARSLDDWKTHNWALYERQLSPFGRVPRESMIVVCEVFDKVFER